jgi:hypothetical protein
MQQQQQQQPAGAVPVYVPAPASSMCACLAAEGFEMADVALQNTAEFVQLRTAFVKLVAQRPHGTPTGAVCTGLIAVDGVQQGAIACEVAVGGTTTVVCEPLNLDLQNELKSFM